MENMNKILGIKPKYPSLMRRNKTIDIVRGIAIFTMIAANLAGEFLKEPHPLALRFYGTFAASSFVMLSGMMNGFAITEKKKPLYYFLKRAIFILGIAALDDVVLWKLYPFMGLDVLYTIALSTPLCYLFAQCTSKIQWGIIVTIFLATPLLQQLLGYVPYPYFYDWSNPLSAVLTTKTLGETLNNWLVSGWFPLFPWLGFALLGVKLYPILSSPTNSFSEGEGRSSSSSFFFEKGRAGAFLLSLGTLLWNIFPIEHLTRGGYSELFYPSTLAYICLAIGVLMTVFYLVNQNNLLRFYQPFEQLGKVSLFVYLMHFTLIHEVIVPIWGIRFMENDTKQPFGVYGLVYLSLSAFLICLAYWINQYKGRWKNKPYLVQLLIGS